MADYNVEYIDLPLVSETQNNVLELDGHRDHHDIQDRGSFVIINFSYVEQVKKVSIVQPWVCNL